MTDDMPPPRLCGRCYDDMVKLFPANCEERPENVHGAIGMYHCPDCGAMVLAGLPHPDLCARCLAREHPQFDLGHNGSWQPFGQE